MGTVGQGAPSGLLAGVAERFADATDFTIGIEEEYQLLDPGSYELVNRYEDLVNAADEPLRTQLAGELISSEIEYKTPACGSLADAARDLIDGRLAVIELAERLGIAIGIGGVHPFSVWQDQRIIDTEHYRRVEEELGYIAWVNNTWSVHLHVGVRGPDRAVAVSTALRGILPELLALSANSPVFMGRDTRLHSARTQIFTRSFPRCGVPDAYLSWGEYADYVALLERTGSIVESTQIWWSVRPHHTFGTVEIRICDGQSEIGDALALAALMVACTAAFCRDYDAGAALPTPARGLIEENIWRAQRHGLEGELIDLKRGQAVSTPAAVRRLLDWSASTHEPLGLTPFLAPIVATLVAGNGAQRQRRAFAADGDPRALVVESVERCRRSALEARAQLATASAT